MPSTTMASGGWKKVLLPALGSRRRRDEGTAVHPLLSTSDTASDIYNVVPSACPAGADRARNTVQGDIDSRLVSAFLDTTAESEVIQGDRALEHFGQFHPFARSHTTGTVPSGPLSSRSSSTSKSQAAAHVSNHIPRRPLPRNLRSETHDNPTTSPVKSSNGLLRPLPQSQSASAHLVGRDKHRNSQSFSGVWPGITGRFKGGSPIRKGGNETDKISHSVTSILTTQDLTGSAIDAADSDRPSKTSRSRARNVITKFTGVLTDHFGIKGSRRREPPESTSAAEDVSTGHVVHGSSWNRLPSSQLYAQSQVATNPGQVSPDEALLLDWEGKRPSAAGTVAGATRPLTIVNEVDFLSGQNLEDPFSESPPGRHSNEFKALLKSKQGARKSTSPTDPFQIECLLETSVDAVLASPPVGCSTPRRRAGSCGHCETPTKKSRVLPLHGPDSYGVPPTGLPVKSERQARGREIYCLKKVPSFHASARHRDTVTSLARKKHPSPSKGQLEIFGKYMEQNLALGMFRDPDELGMSFSSGQPNFNTLSPRDSNQLMRGPAASNPTLHRKGLGASGTSSGSIKARSRIPQPVRQLSRSRTDTAFARDFYPANMGDSTTEDELQWDVSLYNINRHCQHCGSLNKLSKGMYNPQPSSSTKKVK
ncbi:hypothetical protein M406DRAFT_73586 [Cryphonectria parasitica EP155]|uniref:Uncharacterized protein n=1 Tax=Cryphonectria parasitica (strain ATCC 38755 / EP155) TaxID=660469 RepID=A0A9P5CKU7_CRYP1|nr:uncharacterized protein M406DRAFT_73586 [Cryphonectria parasitica EP155]KAF3761150.1 hypothetical protein M406DRAFT_73586 [Cryphonectria parasitica EP155]